MMNIKQWRKSEGRNPTPCVAHLFIAQWTIEMED